MLEAALIVARVLQSLRFEVELQGQPELEAGATLRPVGGLPVVVRRR